MLSQGQVEVEPESSAWTAEAYGPELSGVTVDPFPAHSDPLGERRRVDQANRFGGRLGFRLAPAQELRNPLGDPLDRFVVELHLSAPNLPVRR